MAADPSLVADMRDELYPDLFPAPNEPMKTQMNVRELLGNWARNAKAKEGISVEKDGNPEMFMAQRPGVYEDILDQIDYEMTDEDRDDAGSYQGDHHVLGLAVQGDRSWKELRSSFIHDEGSADSIKAIASVYLESVEDDSGEIVGLLPEFWSEGIAGAQTAFGDELPVLSIADLVGTPEAGAELIYGIVAWAKEMGRAVMITPDSKELETYYRGLGFLRGVHNGVLSDIMVYHGSEDDLQNEDLAGPFPFMQSEDTPSEGLLLDFDLGSDDDAPADTAFQRRLLARPPLRS